MPGSVANAAPATVMPWSLSRAFVRSQEYPVLADEYKNGESDRSRLADTSRKSWRLTKRLTAAALEELRLFYYARNGAREPFYFYDPWDELPKFGGYDPTGVETTGRYTVRFEGAWDQAMGIVRGDVQLALVELA